MNEFLNIAHAEGETSAATTATEAKTEAKAPEGLSIQPTTVAFQLLNFVILVVALNYVLLKPLTKLLAEREKKIKEGVENAEKAKTSLAEATAIRTDMMTNAKKESQAMMEKARKSGEELKNEIVDEAHKEADQIIKSGQKLIEMEKAKTMQELKNEAVKVIVQASEKILREKIDPSKDAKLIQESLQSYS